ncbi:hypothetical protein N8987_04900 [Crocinitomix sp.]|nr:hypothetical protein [Crocinitomix sp.]
MLTVKKKYKDVPTLVNKKGREWRIHYTVIHEFMPKYNTKTKTLYNHDWNTFTTWNFARNYTIDYHKQIIFEIKERLPSNTIAYTVEKDKRGNNHVHMITDAAESNVRELVEFIISRYLDIRFDCVSQTSTLKNKYSVVEYIKKASQESGVLLPKKK